jgi:hypothetical protein
MPQSPDQLAHHINRIGAWLAQDDFQGNGPGPEFLRDLDAIVLLGNQVIATLTAACTLMQRSPAAILVLSGGAGHSTQLLYENLCNSGYGTLARQGLVQESMSEAEIYAVVAQNVFGIPASRILIENRSANSGENCRFSLELLQQANRRLDSVLILQDPLMQRRSMLTWAREAERFGSHERVYSHAVFVPGVEPGPGSLLRFPGDQAQETWTMERFLAILLGEVDRLRDTEEGYGPRGRNFLSHVEIPEAVLESYLRVSASPLAAQALR